MSCKHIKICLLAPLSICQKWLLSIRKSLIHLQNGPRRYFPSGKTYCKSLTRHINSKFSTPTANCWPLQNLGCSSTTVCLGIRSISFRDGHTGICKFAQTIFEMGQSVPASGKIDPNRTCPGGLLQHLQTRI